MAVKLKWDGSLISSVNIKLNPLDEASLNLSYGIVLYQGEITIGQLIHPAAWFLTGKLKSAALAACLENVHHYFGYLRLGSHIFNYGTKYLVVYPLPVHNNRWYPLRLSRSPKIEDVQKFIAFRDLFGVTGSSIDNILEVFNGSRYQSISLCEVRDVYYLVDKWCLSTIDPIVFQRYMKNNVLFKIILQLVGQNEDYNIQWLDTLATTLRLIIQRIDLDLIGWVDYLVKRISNLLETAQEDV